MMRHAFTFTRTTMHPQSTLALVALLAASGCAPAAPRGLLRGSAPGALTAFAPEASGPQRFIAPGTTDVTHRHLGTLAVPAGADSIVLLVYGDNRPGHRLMTTAWGAPAIAAGRRGGVLGLAWAIVNVPVALVQAFVPTLDLFQDLDVSWRSHRPNGGGEARVRRALEALPADAVLSTGDLVQEGTRAGQWEDFLRRHAALREQRLYVAAIGNHERPADPTGAANWSTAIGPPPAPGERWLSFDLPGGLARFVILDSSILTDPHEAEPGAAVGALAAAQLAWADSALAAGPATRFIVMHHPLVSAGQHVSDWQADDERGFAIPMRTRLLDLIRRRDVTAVFVGHEHLYQRAGVRTPDGGGFWHVTTGGGGSPLHRPSQRARRAALAAPLPDGSTVSVATGRSVYHLVRLVVRSRGGDKGPAIDLEALEVSGGGTRQIDRFDLASPVPEPPLRIE